MSKNNIEEKLAGSLTAETTELIPYLPYLLQDIWELGSQPQSMIKLIKDNIDTHKKLNIVDLGCGKGAVAISLCKEFNVDVYGFDLIPEFIEEANTKAKTYNVEKMCTFTVQDINISVLSKQKYDITILGAVGDVLGNPQETLKKLKDITYTGGYILIDEAYLIGDTSKVKYQNYDYLTLNQWKELFKTLDLELIADIESDDSLYDTNNYNNQMIRKRAYELITKYPDKREMFEGYINSQENECRDLENIIVGVTWLLKKH